MNRRFSNSESQLERHEEEVQNIAAELSVSDCYDALRAWYRNNIDSAIEESRKQNSNSDYLERSARLISALPPSSSISELEIRRVVDEVITNKLEWGYWREDDQAYMISYARAILLKLGTESMVYTEAEEEQLRHSRLWPYLNA